jgi:hypothetical protein
VPGRNTSFQNLIDKNPILAKTGPASYGVVGSAGDYRPLVAWPARRPGTAAKHA